MHPVKLFLSIFFFSQSIFAQPTFTENIISTNTSGPVSVYATDVDGDGDMDVLSASSWDNKIAWYEQERSPVVFQPQTKEELQTAVALWVDDNASALSTYGEINTELHLLIAIFLTGMFLMLLICKACSEVQQALMVMFPIGMYPM